MRVLFATAELTPIAKVGGLADVAGALPIALKDLGTDVRVIMPKYGTIDLNKYPAKKIIEGIKVSVAGKLEEINLWETKIPNSEVIIYLIEHPIYLGKNGIYFEKDAFCDSFAEIQRFTFWSKALLEIFEAINFWPEIIHCQDWHTGLIPVILEEKQKTDPRYQKIKTLFTIHNLANQGRYNKQEVLNFLELKESNHPNLQAKLASDDISIIQQGILGADLLNAVSPSYAEEILTPEYGEGLEGSLQKRKKILSGIVNGIDVNLFNPRTDPMIKVQYDPANPEGKLEDKLDLQKETGLKQDKETPIFGWVSRLHQQKGMDLIFAVIDEIMKEDCQLIILGTGAEDHEKMARAIAREYPEQTFIKLGFDAGLAQKIYAGSDIFLMPSRFEPCGLGQMIAMRYGTIPIVRATGGLKDTVKDFNPATNEGDGFVFNNFEKKEFWTAVKRALAAFKNKEAWNKIVTRDMAKDFSWTKSAKEYLKLYQALINQQNA